MSSFFGGLLQGFGSGLEKKAESDYAEKRQRRRSLEQILSQVDPTTLDEAGRQQYGELIDQTYGDIIPKGKKGGGIFQKPSDAIHRVLQTITGHNGSGAGQEHAPLSGDYAAPGSWSDPNVMAARAAAAQAQPSTPNATPPVPAPPPYISRTTPPFLPSPGPSATPTPQPVSTGAAQPVAPTPAAATGPAIPGSVPAPPAPPASVTQGVRQPTTLGNMLTHRISPMAQEMTYWQQKEDILHNHRLGEIQEQNKRGGAYTKKSTVTGDMLPENSTDAYGRPIDPKQHYVLAENRVGEQQYLPTDAPRQTAIAEKRAQAVTDRMAATGEDETTATHNVAIGEYKQTQQESMKRMFQLSGMKLSQEALRLRMTKLQQEIDNGNLSTKNAKFIWQSAYQIARTKKQDKGATMETMMADVDTLAAKEMEKMGLSYNEVVQALRSPTGAVKPGAPPAKKPVSGLKVELSPDGKISVSRGQ